jgi:transposase-like protein
MQSDEMRIEIKCLKQGITDASLQHGWIVRYTCTECRRQYSILIPEEKEKISNKCSYPCDGHVVIENE